MLQKVKFTVFLSLLISLSCNAQDISGIAISDSYESVKNAVEKLVKFDATLKLVDKNKNETGFIALQEVQKPEYTKADQFTVFKAQNGDVWFFQRKQTFAPEERMTVGVLEDALIEKYGSPSIKDEYRLIWFYDAKGALYASKDNYDYGPCGSIIDHAVVQTFTLSQKPRLYARVDGIPSLFSENCGKAVIVNYGKDLKNENIVTYLIVTLVNADVMYKQVEDAEKEEERLEKEKRDFENAQGEKNKPKL